MTSIQRRPWLATRGPQTIPLRSRTLGTLSCRWTSQASGQKCWLDRFCLGLFSGLCDSWVFTSAILNMFQLCWEILRVFHLQPELGILRDIIEEALSPHLDVELGKRWSRGCAAMWLPKDMHLGDSGKMREKIKDHPSESSSSWPILENQGAILLKIPWNAVR